MDVLDIEKKLRPCPFCGGRAKLYFLFDIGWWQVGCYNLNCIIMPKANLDTSNLDKIVEVWNKRKYQSPPLERGA